MYTVVRQYKVKDRDAVAQIADRAREGFVPLITKAQGFVGYRLVDAGEDGVVTVSTFQDKAGADESVRIASEWVGQNLAALVDGPPKVTGGEVRIREVRQGATYGAAIMRRYQFDPADIDALVQRVRDGLVPLITATEGFAGYQVVDAGDGAVLSLSAFADEAAADASQAQATDWVKQNLATFMKSTPQVVRGTVKLARP